MRPWPRRRARAGAGAGVVGVVEVPEAVTTVAAVAVGTFDPVELAAPLVQSVRSSLGPGGFAVGTCVFSRVWI